MEFETDSRSWRWMVLAATVINIAFNGISQRIAFGEGTVDEIARRHPSLFTPAGYAFAIWGLIYLATLAYSIHQLLPAQRHTDAHDLLARPIIALNLLGMAWLAVFQHDLISLSMMVMVVTLFVGALFFLRAAAAVRRHAVSKWVLLPASLWFAWLSVATIANIAIWLAAMGWTDANPVPWTLGEIGLAVLLGLLVGNRYRNWMYPLVIAWAAIAIWVERRADVEIVALSALLSAALMIAWAVYCAWRARRDRRGFRIFHGPLDAG